MKELTVEEIRKIQIEMLVYIDIVCNDTNLNYFLQGGTLIGAIRHKGYIPWDDDVDIYMPLEDYNKFINIINSKEKNRYLVLNPYENEDYYYFFSKFVDKETVLIENGYKQIKNMGVFVDVFPMYNLPDSTEELEKYSKKLIKLEKIYFRNYGFLKYYNDSNNLRRLIKMILYFPEHILLKNKKNILNKKILKLMEKYKNVETDILRIYSSSRNCKRSDGKEYIQRFCRS